jgi:hypothetical protein
MLQLKAGCMSRLLLLLLLYCPQESGCGLPTCQGFPGLLLLLQL